MRRGDRLTIDWRDVHLAAFGNPYHNEPKVCVVSSRYSGCYEGGLFVAIGVEDLDTAAFGQDCAASAWWDKHQDTVGVGPTPNDALLDWYQKRAGKVVQ